MSKEKTSEKYQRQTRYRESKAKSGQRQISVWLDEETIEKLDELADGATRSSFITQAVNDKHKNKLEDDKRLEIATNHKEGSGWGSW